MKVDVGYWLIGVAKGDCCGDDANDTVVCEADATMETGFVSRPDIVGVSRFKNSLVGLTIGTSRLPEWFDSAFGSMLLRLRWPPRGTVVVSMV